MNEHRSQEQELFDAARKLSQPAQRAAFLEAACAGDAALRQRLDELLASQDAADDFFRPLPQLHDGSPPPAMAEPPVDEQVGTMVGRYKLLQKIGEGGFGVVYLAEQKEPVKRRVALKIIKLGMDTKQVVARFEAERQALALLDHPNIAKVFDGGSTDSGRPYFVMELVRGVPITQYCDEHCLSTGERLELFLQVCQAVQHSHQKAIIHRDLKPSNILITVNDGKAVPKVIDFGVAKATQQELTEKTIFTQFHHFIGTPAYMSPEQTELTSLDIDTRSDIYALGVLLYELLTGKTPFDGKELLASGLDEMRRTIRETEPPRPSTRLSTMPGGDRTTAARLRQTEPPKLDHELRGDLDWIVMKCLEKDRNRRYETANGLAADLQRHLSSEPVIARPPSAIYRLQKAIRRNKLAFAAALAVTVALLGGMAATSWQAFRARRAESLTREQAVRAEAAEKQATAVKNFLTDQLFNANPFETPAPSTNYENRHILLNEIAQAIEGKFADQPLVEEEIRHALSKGLIGFGEIAKVIRQMERLLELKRRRLPPGHPDIIEVIGVLAANYIAMGRQVKGEQLLGEIEASLLSEGELSQGAAMALWARASLRQSQGRPADGLPDLERAIPVLTRAYGPTEHRVIGINFLLALMTQQAGRPQEAERLWIEGTRHFESLLRTDHPGVAQFLKGHAWTLLETKRPHQAIPLLERATSIFGPALAEDHSSALDAQDLLARAYEATGDTVGAAGIYSRTYPHWVKHLPYGPAFDHCQIIASFFVRQGRYEEARAVFGSLREFQETSPIETASALDTFIVATGATKGWPAAAEVCRKYLDRFGDAPAICRTMGTALLYTGDIDGYRQAVAKVLALTPAVESPDEMGNILGIVLLGTTEFTPDQVSRCEALIKAVERGWATATEDKQNSGCRAIGGILLRLGRLTESLDYLERAEKKFPSGINRARVLVLKSLCLHGLGGRSVDARAAFDEAEAITQPELLDHLNEREGFLDQPERTYLIHRREAMALLGGTQTNQ